MKKILLLIFLNLYSCSHSPLITEQNQKSQSDQFFPDGIYKQDIYVEYVDEKDKEKKSHTFYGVLKKTSQEISLYSYVGFGIGLFKIKDNLTGDVQFKGYDERIEKNKKFFMKIYPLIKEVLMLNSKSSKLQVSSQGWDLNLTTEEDHFPVHVTISSKKFNQVPLQIVIENEKYFKFQITTTDFEAAVIKVN